MARGDCSIEFGRSRVYSALNASIGLIIYGIVAFPLRGWIIDDAGISFAYARSLASGYGLVSQPGVAPVEGFSNLAWILTLVPTFWLKLFDPVITPKIIAALLAGCLFYLIDRIYSGTKNLVAIPSLVVILLLATNASFVIWTTSGLENALLALLVTVLVWYLMRFYHCVCPKINAALIAAVVVFAIQLTRPEGIAYIIAFPVVLALDFVWNRGRTSLQKTSAYYFSALLLLVIGYIAWRYNYFGDYLSNTYRAKGGPNIQTVSSILTMNDSQLTRLMELTRSVFGSAMNIWLILAVVVTSTACFIKNRLDFTYAITLFMALLTAVIYLLLPYDWMGEFRFATPFFVFYYATLVMLGTFMAQTIPNRIGRVTIGAAAIVLLIGLNMLNSYPRLRAIHDRPPVSFTGIVERFGRTFNCYAEVLNVSDGSILLPDVGGTLYYSDLRVIDLAGLTDRTVTQTIKNDKPEFYDYIFGRTRPTFIHIHGHWTYLANLEADFRFRRDYVAIREYEDPWIKKTWSKDMYSGDYVRRDVAAGNEAAMAQIKNNDLDCLNQR